MEYVVIIGFSDLRSLRSWVTSEERQYHTERAKARGILSYRVNEYGGSVPEIIKRKKFIPAD
jgi:antibiotic biosynthesis monooxygenase (ABM) superfamily enzyme